MGSLDRTPGLLNAFGFLGGQAANALNQRGLAGAQQSQLVNSQIEQARLQLASFNDWAIAGGSSGAGITPAPKSLREELQAEIDEWLPELRAA